MIKTIFQRRQSTAHNRQKIPLADTFQKIPPEVVERIFIFLPFAPDLICFSLSCKYIFACFQSLLKLHEIRLSQLMWLQPLQGPWLTWKLLHRLENDRWKFCTWCEKLHPYSTWRAFRSIWRLRENRCCSIRDLPGFTIRDI